MKVYKYATGEEIPKGAIYLWSTKKGYGKTEDDVSYPKDYEFVWHYFLIK